MTISASSYELLLFLFPLSLLFVCRQRFFSCSHSGDCSRKRWRGIYAAVAFFLYCTIGSISPKMANLLVQLYTYFGGFTPAPEAKLQLTQCTQLFVSFFVLFTYSRMPAGAIRSSVWGSGAHLSKLLKGIAFGIAVYPTIMLCVHIVHMIVEMAIPFVRSEQRAVQQLITCEQFTTLYWILVIQIVTIVPIVEEILFRGFFQKSFNVVRA